MSEMKRNGTCITKHQPAAEVGQGGQGGGGGIIQTVLVLGESQLYIASNASQTINTDIHVKLGLGERGEQSLWAATQPS